jgi:hypothetical protein
MTYSPPTWITQFDGEGQKFSPSPYTYGVNEPPVDWRPFSSNCAWNIPIPANPNVSADSTAVVAWINSLGGPVDRYMGTGGTTDDYDHPWYFAKTGDPLLRIKGLTGSKDPSVINTTASSGSRLRASDLQNRLIPVPSVTTAAGGTDGSLVIITERYAYEMWQASHWTPGEGQYGCNIGAVYDLTGDGYSTDGHSASAGGGSLLVGQIRLSELMAGRINHALSFITKAVRWNTFVAPAIGVANGDSSVTPGDANDLQRPVTGSRFQLNYTQAEINALPVPDWKKTILTAMREYGMLLIDTGGSTWGLEFESGTADVAYGKPDRWRAFAAAQGWVQVGGASTPYQMPLKTGVDWSRLRVVSW